MCRRAASGRPRASTARPYRTSIDASCRRGDLWSPAGKFLGLVGLAGVQSTPLQGFGPESVEAGMTCGRSAGEHSSPLQGFGPESVEAGMACARSVGEHARPYKKAPSDSGGVEARTARLYRILSKMRPEGPPLQAHHRSENCPLP